MADVASVPSAGAGIGGDNGAVLAVLANTAITGGLGAVFWIVAAVLFDASLVGTSVAASSLLIALAFLAQMNLSTALSRFLPTAGDGQRRLVIHSYGTTLAASLLVAAVVLAVGFARGGSLVSGGDRSLTIVTALSIPVWVVFALQDGVVVAMGKSGWLPIENGITSLAKLALLPVLVALPGRSGVLLAWTLPAVLAVAVVNQLIFSKLVAHGRGSVTTSTNELLRYATADMIGVVAMVLSLRVVPLVVVEAIDDETAAFVGVPWSILAVALLALNAVSRLVLAEISRQPHNAVAVANRMTRTVLLLFVPASVVGAVLALPVLSFAGGGYVDVGAPVLAVGCLSLAPAAMIECRFAALRFEHRLSHVVVLQIVRALLLMIGVAIFLGAGKPSLLGIPLFVANMALLPFLRKFRNGG